MAPWCRACSSPVRREALVSRKPLASLVALEAAETAVTRVSPGVSYNGPGKKMTANLWRAWSRWRATVKAATHASRVCQRGTEMTVWCGLILAFLWHLMPTTVCIYA
jgi:hypothetical protein